MMNNNLISYQSIYSNQIYLNSGLGDIYLNGSKKSNIAFFFKDVLKNKNNTIETRLSVVNAEFPISWYLINESNNNIIINNISYLFPVGNYNVNTFMLKWVEFFGNSWSIIYNKYTNIFTWSYSQGIFTFKDNLNSLLEIIGFKKGLEYTSSGNVLSALFPFNFLNISRINIKSSTFNLKNVDSNNKSESHIICSIPVNANNNSMIYYNNFSHYKSIIKNSHLQNIVIEIVDDFDNYIDFHNLNWSISLQIDCVNEVVESLDTLEDIYNNN